MNRQGPRNAGAALAAGFLVLLWLERRRPLRPRPPPDASRVGGNIAAGVAAALTVAVLEQPIVQRVAQQAAHRRIGLVPLLRLPSAAEKVVGLVLLDYTLYLWHILLHRSPMLWRWHCFHHADRGLDASTALRFHAMEMLWSLPWRLAQVALIGVPPATLRLWGQLTAAEVMFHHSNLRLPAAAESVLRRVVVTPAMHGVHHANRADLQHANFSSGLMLWDHLHGTCRAVAAPEQVTIGLPAERGERGAMSSAHHVRVAAPTGLQPQLMLRQDQQSACGRSPDPVLQETPRVRCRHLRQQAAARVPPQPLAEDHVLQDAHLGEAAQAFEQVAPHEDAVVTVVDAVEAALEVVPRGDQGQAPVAHRKAVGQGARLKSGRSSFLHGEQRARSQSGVDVQEQQDVARGGPGAGVHLAAAPAPGPHHAHAGRGRHELARAVGAAPIGDDHFVLALLRQQLGQCLAQDLRFVEHGNDDADHAEMIGAPC